MGHANARLTAVGRRLLVQRVRVNGWTVAAAAESMGVSRQCAHRWLKRWDAGDHTLADRSSRPRSMPTRTPVEVERLVVAARERFRKGPDWLAADLGLAPRTVSRILRRHRLPYLRELDLVTGEAVRASKKTAVRYERPAPGDLVHMDTKKIARIPEGGGSFTLGRMGYRTEARKKIKPGYEYVHSAVDDNTRIAYSEVLPSENAPDCAGFFERAVRFYATLGIKVRGLMTDNAWSYRNSNQLAALLAKNQIEHIFIQPHCPWQNGKVERFNRILKEEWIYAGPWTSSQQRTATLDEWLHEYNHHRPHGALRYQPPVSRL
jgi:transposase InsO family protein